MIKIKWPDLKKNTSYPKENLVALFILIIIYIMSSSGSISSNVNITISKIIIIDDQEKPYEA